MHLQKPDFSCTNTYENNPTRISTVTEETAPQIDEVRTVTAAVAPDVHLAIRMHAIKNNISMQKLTGEILTAWATENVL
jgi:hypothetical protein